MQPLDTLARPLKALRLSVTDRCNFRCTYCMPKEIFGPDYPFLPREALLSFEEIARLVRIFAGLGVTKLRLTGGEPLMRRELPALVRMVATVPGIDDLALTTNGVLLPDLASPLREAGLKPSVIRTCRCPGCWQAWRPPARRVSAPSSSTACFSGA